MTRPGAASAVLASAALASAVLASAVLLAACAGPVPIPAETPAPTLVAPPSSSPGGEPSTAPPPSDAAPSGDAEPSLGPAAGPVLRDDSLLAVLPPDLDGVPVTVEEPSFAEAARDRAFANNVERAAFAVIATPTDLASGVVAKLREGVFADGFFADWRDTYAEGACAQAGGVATNAQTDLGGRTVYITTCGGGLRVYHAYLEQRRIIVSLFSIGEGRYGERLIAGLRP